MKALSLLIESNSLQCGENDADIKPRVWHVYHRWRRRLIRFLSSRILCIL